LYKNSARNGEELLQITNMGKGRDCYAKLNGTDIYTRQNPGFNAWWVRTGEKYWFKYKEIYFYFS